MVEAKLAPAAAPEQGEEAEEARPRGLPSGGGPAGANLLALMADGAAAQAGGGSARSLDAILNDGESEDDEF